MIRVFAHRGLWTRKSEQNSIAAHSAALGMGFGTEIDVRDFEGRAVIAHDPHRPEDPEPPDLAEFLRIAGPEVTIALNLKVCGLLSTIAPYVQSTSTSAFLFDLPGPEMLEATRMGLRFFTRVSPFEPTPHFAETAAGIVMDSFGEATFFNAFNFERLDARKPLFIISDDIHGLNPDPQWELIRRKLEPSFVQIGLCTDLPQRARDFFS